MPITFQTPPAAAVSALARGAARVSAATQLQATRAPIVAGAARLLAQAQRGGDPPTALPVHFPSAADVAAGRLDAAAAPVRAWRHFVPTDGTRASAVAETLADGAEHRFASFTDGAFPAALSSTIQTLRGDRALARRDLSAAALQVNEIGLRAVWLQARDQGDDVIVPLAPTPDGVEAGRRYTRAELVPKLQAALAARQAQAGPNVEF
jgi:hypothetical protein